MKFLRLIFVMLAVALAPSFGGAVPPEGIVSADILPGWQVADGRRMAAIRLRLAPGWKTYWRHPGEAGLPPRFDWSGSANLRAVRLIWPAPGIFLTSGLRTIGYHDELVLPIEVTPEDPAAPIALAVEMDLGICSNICVPARVDLAGIIHRDGRHDPVIEAALRARPETAEQAGLSRLACRVEPIRDGLHLVAEMTLPARGADEMVAIEPGDPAIWTSDVRTVRRGDTLQAAVDLVPPAGAPFVLRRSDLVLTVISDRGAVEIRGCPAAGG